MNKLSGKVALVTGASRGIGRAIAIEFARQGATVVVNYSSNEGEAKKTIELMGDAGQKARLMQFDVSSSERVDEAVAKIKDDIGFVDILVNNAGITRDGLIMRMKDEDLDAQLQVNLKSAFYCTRAVVRHMLKQKAGRIITISSVVGEMGNAGQSAYAAAKAGLIGMTKSLARELSSRNILVNAITPGYIATDMTKEILETALEKAVATIPLGRIGVPEDVAKAAAFLASDDASYITGQVLAVNGGLYI